MENKPQRKRGTLIFWLLFLAIATAISATVLLANQHRNLKHLMRWLGLPLHETMVIPKPGGLEKFRGRRLQGVAVLLDPYVFMHEIKGMESAFLRSMKKDGENLCDLFNRSGFPMSKWQPGTFAKKVNECWYELAIPNAEKPDDPSTFFLMIKGAQDGTLVSTRVKFIFTDAAARAKLTAMAAEVLTDFADATKWTEIADQKNKLLALTPFNSTLSGVSARFSSEFSGSGRYNLIFSRTDLNPAQKRTEDYFEHRHFYPLLPEHGGPAIAAAQPKP
ncbi:hypothetical protein JJB09_01120 [Rhizobium sp. KVB221]|uniref:Uncharacterized protein n=1 Tax=Rhizobium setariae TaxID=2801340 RepID=A0A936YLZ6_9HYPH|nr:DUF6030 family protein [Rhizobium setariae]MBL0370616.1 hypothetical protein [Rhizobium setariae]